MVVVVVKMDGVREENGCENDDDDEMVQVGKRS